MRDTIETARGALRTVRTIERNNRLRRYQGRNGGAQLRHLADLNGTAGAAIRDLPRDVGAAITAEHRLAGRVSKARDDGQDRPELRERLNAARRTIRNAACPRCHQPGRTAANPCIHPWHRTNGRLV